VNKPPEWIDLMIDLETMGLPPDAAMVSVGACFFDVQREEIGPTFYRNINLATAVADGGTMNPATIMWWLEQGDEARRAILYDCWPIRHVLQEFSDFIQKHSTIPDVRPWGNGAGFDLTVMNSAYLRAGIKTPWRFGRERCFRTIRNWYEKAAPYDPDEKGDGAHNAVIDAKFQAQHIIKIKRALAAKKASS
jgi:exodeoxyribonuclease VIII